MSCRDAANITLISSARVAAITLPVVMLLLLTLLIASGEACSFDAYPAGSVEVRLTWEGDSDLDLHVSGLGPDGRRFRASYMNRFTPGCEFQKDAFRGGASESIFIHDTSYGPYQVYVYNYSWLKDHSQDLGDSSARVEIICDGALKASFGVPEECCGNQWGVCAMDQSSILPTNHVSFEREPAKVGRDPLSTLVPGDILMGTERDTNIPTRWSHVGIYVGSMVSEKPSLPHSKPLMIKALTMSPVPCFNKQRSGCRPFCDVLIGETKIFTTSQEYERMR